MLRRIMLAIAVIAALGVAGLATPNSADAQRWRWGRPYYGYYYGAPRAYYYGYGVPYRTYYPGSYYYTPYYGSYGYYGPTYYYGAPTYYRPAPRVAFRLGW